MTQTRRTLGYRPELDGFRALAIVGVMLFHTEWLWYKTNHFGWGWKGVDLFFVLSGFLITSLLIRERESTGRISRAAFYGRRALRLLPALVLALAFAGIVCARFGNGPWRVAYPFPKAALSSLFFLGNWVGVQKLGVLSHTWSLGLEEQYYLVWPAAIALAFRRRMRPRRLAAYLGAIAVGVAVLRTAQMHGLAPTAWAGVKLDALSRSDGILIGSALALLLAGDRRGRLEKLLREPAVAACALILIVPLAFVPSALHLGPYDAVFPLDLCFALVIGHAFANRDAALGRVLRTQPLPALGRISYGVYIFHWPIFYLAAHLTQDRSAAVGGAWAATFVVAALSYVAVERPALKLKRRVATPAPRGRTGGGVRPAASERGAAKVLLEA